MAESNRRLPTPGYGTINTDLIGRWLRLGPADDGPFWALNLMRYHEVAQYDTDDTSTGDSARAPRSGREADDEYAPLGPLAAIGARVVFHGDVIDQTAGTPGWHRVGIVRYPTRAAFFAMQQRDDFKSQHVHKEAGMEFTIVMSCLPIGASDTHPETSGPVTLIVELDDERDDQRDGAGAGIDPSMAIASFDVEGVIVGDERRWRRAHFVTADAATSVALDTGHQVITIAADITRLVASTTEEQPS